MKKYLSFFAVFLLFVVSIIGQTSADFEKKFGAEKYYKIRPNTLISAAFDNKGQVCRVKIIPDPFPNPNANLFRVAYHIGDTEHLIPIPIIDSSELKEIFEELVPPNTRKGDAKIIKDFSGFGGYYRMRYRFENVGLDVGVLIQNTTKIDTQKVGENFDSIINPTNGVIFSAIIYWTEKKCVEN